MIRYKNYMGMIWMGLMVRWEIDDDDGGRCRFNIYSNDVV